MKKRLSALLLALLLIFSLFTACSEEEINTALQVAETVVTVLDEYDSEETEPPAQTEAPAALPTAKPAATPAPTAEPELEIAEDGQYSSKEDVALYIHTYGRLPSNFITKNEAKKLGWVSSEGNLWEVAPGMSIGGDYFGNREGRLPKGDYTECDIDYAGGYRGEKRIVFSDEGIYYTEDHYNSFEQLY